MHYSQQNLKVFDNKWGSTFSEYHVKQTDRMKHYAERVKPGDNVVSLTKLILDGEGQMIRVESVVVLSSIVLMLFISIKF